MVSPSNAQNPAWTVQQHSNRLSPRDGILIATSVHRNTAPTRMATRRAVGRPCMRTAAY